MELKISMREKYQLLRKQKKIKLKALAEDLGVSIPMLSMYENNKVNLCLLKETKYRELIEK